MSLQIMFQSVFHIIDNFLLDALIRTKIDVNPDPKSANNRVQIQSIKSSQALRPHQGYELDDVRKTIAMMIVVGGREGGRQNLGGCLMRAHPSYRDEQIGRC